MPSLLQLWDKVKLHENHEGPLNSAEGDASAIQTIRFGLGLRSDKGNTFWTDFLKMCQNDQGFAELLGVRPDQVSSWSGKIQGLVNQVESEDNSGKNNVLPTGLAKNDGTFSQSPF